MEARLDVADRQGARAHAEQEPKGLALHVEDWPGLRADCRQALQQDARPARVPSAQKDETQDAAKALVPTWREGLPPEQPASPEPE
jgi:hypothetical protein